MTLDTTVRRVNYQGDDRTTCFPFPFKVWGEEQVVVYCSDPATPWTETNITQRTTITLNADNYGGAVRFANPPASGLNLAIVREGSFLQEDEYLSGSRFDAHEIEDRFDEDAAERQELLDATARSIKVPNSSTQTPEEVYEELLSGSAFVNNSIASLTELYNQALYYYNLTMGYLGETSYMQARETSFIIDKTHIVDGDDGEGDWVCEIPNGFKYYPTTHQLLVTVDGLALTPDVHFSETGDYGEESDKIRFKINMYQGQQVYIKALFLGTEEFNVKLQEMNDKVEAAEKDLQDLIESAKKELQGIIDSLGSGGGGDSGGDSGGGGSYDNSGGGSFIQPTQGSCSLTNNYCVGCYLSLPSNVCYYYNTNTLHLAIDGLVLSPKYFEEINNDNGATCVKLCDICLYKDQELYAWTDGFWCSQK